MRKRGRRKYLPIRTAKPALRDWPRIGDGISVYSSHGDPRETSTPLNEAFAIPNPFRLEPIIFLGYFEFEPLTTHELERLREACGAEISASLRTAI